MKRLTVGLVRHRAQWVLALLLAGSSGHHAVAAPGTADAPGPALSTTARPGQQVRADARNRFSIDGDTVNDAHTGLTWAAQDNGSDIDWNGALHYCAELGSGWELPTIEELLALADGSDGYGESCAYASCELSVQFTSFWFWTRETNGSDEAWIVSNGQRFALSVANTKGTRAYCVRRPSR